MTFHNELMNLAHYKNTKCYKQNQYAVDLLLLLANQFSWSEKTLD